MSKIKYKLLHNNKYDNTYKEQNIQSRHIIIFCMIIFILQLLYWQTFNDAHKVNYVDKNVKDNNEKLQKCK